MASHLRMEDTNSHHMGPVLHLWGLKVPWVHNRHTCTCNMDNIRVLHHPKDLLGHTVERTLVPCMHNVEVLP